MFFGVFVLVLLVLNLNNLAPDEQTQSFLKFVMFAAFIILLIVSIGMKDARGFLI